MGANGNINDLELAKFIELAGEYGIRVHLLHGDSWLPAVANLAALPATGNTTGDIRQLLDTGVPYRWNGSAWSVWSTSGTSWGAIAGTLSDQIDLQSALDAKMGAGAYVLVSRDSLLTNQINLGDLTTGILKQTVSAGIATISILTDNSGNWNTAYMHSQVTSGNPHNVKKSEVGLGNVDNTADTAKPVSTAQQTALNLKQDTSGKDATGGYVGMTLFKINFKNALNTFTSFFTNSNTAARTYIFQDRDGTIADDTDLALKENLTNKSTNVTTDGASDTKYPSVKSIKDYVDTLVSGLLDYRGGYDASVNTFPASGGSGSAGAVVKGDMWVLSVAGTLGGTAVQIGDSLIANVDTPGQTAGNWNILNSNISYVPEDVANKSTSVTTDQASDTKYPSVKSVYDWATGLFAPKTSPTFGTSINGSYLTASEILITDASKNIVSAPVASYPSLAELAYVKGVTSAIQTQINAKAPSNSPTFTGTVILPKTVEIQDTTGDHQYVLAVSELIADRTITLPLLTGNDEFVFKDHIQALANKTLTAPIITTSINAQTGTTYTLVLTDQSKLVTLTNAAAIAVTIPANASVAFPVGTQIDFSQDGAGKVTFSGAGVTINSLSSLKSIGGQYVGATLIKTATDTWNLYGNLIA